jgi:hypothetical protein
LPFFESLFLLLRRKKKDRRCRCPGTAIWDLPTP